MSDKSRSGAVAAAHPLAVSAANHMFRAGGNAVDAAIAAQAVIAVVSPQSAGLGGDMLALVAAPTGAAVGINGTGRSSSVRSFPSPGAVGDAVTVPGLVEGWFDLHESGGSLPMEEVLRRAIELAAHGYLVDEQLVRAIDQQRVRISKVSPDATVLGLVVGQRWCQPELAETLRALATHGPGAFYAGARATAIVDAVRHRGGSLSLGDLLEQESQIGAPIEVPWDGGRVFVQPPSSQGVLLAVALKWLDQRFGDFSPDQLDHVLVELTASVFELREDCALGRELLTRPLVVDAQRATNRRGPRAYLHTAGVATVDAAGGCVSSLVSVFDDFGSAVWVPELGIFLNNRADGFTAGANVAAPAKRPIHTLAPALVLPAGGHRYAIATPGADGQVQTLLQVLTKVRQGRPLADAIAAPRWRGQDGELVIQSDHPHRQNLGVRGHRLKDRDGADDIYGAVVAAGGAGQELFALADWRRQTAAGHV